MDETLIPFDLRRMILGTQPLLFYAEVLVRTLIVYGYTLAMVRWIGGRGVAQLSMVEIVLVVGLGSAVGDTMFYPEVPLLVGLLVITLVVGANKLLDKAIMRSDLVKLAVDGRPVALVRAGAILPDGLAIASIGTAEVKAMLRIAGIETLGEVRLACLESGGQLSVFRQDPPRPGLGLLPPADVVPVLPDGTDDVVAVDGVCCRCGAPRTGTVAPCAPCGGERFVAPMLPGAAR